jgi:small-conductance mechanosensitive channel
LHHGIVLAMILTLGWCLLHGLYAIEDIFRERYDVGATDNLRARAVQTQVQTLRNIAAFAIIVITIGLALTTFESVRQVGAGLLASAGIAGVVLGFAAQKSLGAILAGIQIAFTQPIRIDDVVIVEGEWGRIEEIKLTYVVVRIWDLRRLVVPITYFIEQPFQNWTRTSADLLGTVFLYLDYAVPLDTLREEFQRQLDAHPLWDKKVGKIQITDSTERSMQVRFLMSAEDASKAWDLRCDLRESLITYVQKEFPSALPKVRAELKTAGGSPA